MMAMAPLFGILVGIVLALTGAGGAILAVPLLVFGLHLQLPQAAPVGLMAVAVAAGLGAALALREHILRYRAAALMAATGALASPAGLWLAQRVPERPLNLLFAAVLAWVGWRMLRDARREMRGEKASRPASPPCRFDTAVGRLRWTAPCAARIAAAGAVAGLLSGLLGVGGGFVIVPALLAITDLPVAAVTATSVGVIAAISLAGVAAAAWGGTLPWAIALPFAAGAAAGMFAGRLFAAKLRGPRLQQGFAAVAVMVSAGLVVRAVA